MADIVERLRVRAINPSREITFADGSKVVIESLPARDALLEEAAAEIERLRGILAQIRVSQDPIEMVGLAALATEQSSKSDI